ncbi:MAG: CCA tRNA nucleotidyltransferase [Pseudomonadota bacterium]
MTQEPILTLNDDHTSDWIFHPAVQSVFELLKPHGFETRVVGGAVRNALLGYPIKDIDFATTALPEDVLRLAGKANMRAIPTGLAHGTITLCIEDRSFEITTLRRDIETDGRHAKVAATYNWTEDAQRRDFTINALYADQHGHVYDPLNGYQDILQKRLCFIGDANARIKEDYLRILRFFRFQAQYHLSTLDLNSINACTRHHNGLRKLSGERVASEMLRLLCAPMAYDGVQLMFRYGVLAHVLCQAVRLSHLDNLIGIYKTLGTKPDSILCLAALSIYTSKDAIFLSERLKLSRSDRKALKLAASITPSDCCLPSLENAKRDLFLLGQENYQKTILIRWARSSDFNNETAWHEILTLPERWSPPIFPISGSDLITLGFSQGSILGGTLLELKNEWINSHFKLDRNHLLQKARVLQIGEQS